jgi:hypothetical protein
MKILLTFMRKCCVASLWASPHATQSLLPTADFLTDRMLQKLKAYDPGFPRDDPVPELPTAPARPFPTDVPAPEPHDVPAPEPIDVPPPDPGEVPRPAQPSKRSKEEPKTRPIP